MKLKIDKVDQNNFIGFVNRLKLIDSFIYFKIKDNQVVSSAYLPQRDAVKHNSFPTSEIFTITGDAGTEKELKVAFFDASRLIEAFKQFDYQTIQGEIEFIENEEDCVATSFKIFNEELEITLACSEPSLGYKDLTDSQLQSIFAVEGADFVFGLSNLEVGKIKSLFNLDKDETFNIVASSTGVKMSGKSYNKQVSPDFEGEKGNVTVYKKYLGLLDKEDYKAHVFGNRVVLRSTESATLLTIATCQSAD
jgi:hypothetical protein